MKRNKALAVTLALSLLLLFPATSEAYATLLKSDPVTDAVLTTAPAQVRLWFSENLNPTFSQAEVVNAANQRIDVNGSLVIPTNVREMDVSLTPDLPSDVYAVRWRTQSAADGDVLNGSFFFHIANPDGTIPQLHGTTPGQHIFGAVPGQFDGIALFNLIMLALVEIGVVFWVGAQLWHAFILQMTDASTQSQRSIEQQAEERFVRRFSQPMLCVLFLANIGVLLGQALAITGGRWDQIFSPTLLFGLITNGHFGLFWIMREIVIVLAMALTAYSVLARRHSRIPNGAIPWVNLLLALALLIAMTLSGHAAAVTGILGVYAVLVDWLHLLAAALWIGGILYLATIYLPVLQGNTAIAQTRSLLATLPRFLPLAIAGIILMAASGPFNATVHMSSWSQLVTTAYGRTLIVKVVLVGALLLINTLHVFRLHPHLRNVYKKYMASSNGSHEVEAEQAQDDSAVATKSLEHNLVRQTSRISNVVRWEALLGIAILICSALMTTFAGTLVPVAAHQPSAQHTTPQSQPFNTTVSTTDHKFTAKLNITPDHSGPNVFTITVLNSNGKQDTNVVVSLHTTMLDMDMGTDTLPLQPDMQGNFKASGNLGMAGHWQIRIQIRIPDTTLHEAKVQIVVP